MKKIEKLTYINERGESVEFSHRSPYHTNEIIGISDIRNSISSYYAMGQDGDTFVSNRIEAREIELVGNINTRNKDEMITLRRMMTHIMNPHFSAILRYEYGDFVRVISCRIDNAPIFYRNSVFMGFTVQLICLDPFWRDENETINEIASWVGSFEFPLEIPQETGIEMGYREPSTIVNVYNGGDVRTGLVAEFIAEGATSNPKIQNIDTGEFIKFNGLNLMAGDRIVVNTNQGQKTIDFYHNGIYSDATRYIDPGSTFIQLNVGDNYIRYEADENVENLTIAIIHTNLYLGV